MHTWFDNYKHSSSNRVIFEKKTFEEEWLNLTETTLSHIFQVVLLHYKFVSYYVRPCVSSRFESVNSIARNPAT